MIFFYKYLSFLNDYQSYRLFLYNLYFINIFFFFFNKYIFMNKNNYKILVLFKIEVMIY